MEKEYKDKFDEAESLLSIGKKEDALYLLSEINWKKAHNQNVFMKAAEIYEKALEYKSAKEILKMSHERSPMGRKALKQLSLLCAKMHEFEEAEEYLNEFTEIAPNDPDKYLITYEIKKESGAGNDELIEILENYKKEEFDDRWALFLAYLYHDNGDTEKCIEICDEIYTYFGEGIYVEKALELKMTLRPLSKDQEESYKSFQYKKDGLTEIRANEVLESGEIINHTIAIPKIELSPDRFNTVNLQAEIKKNIEEIMQATEAASVSENMEAIKDLVNDLPYLDQKKEDPEEEVSKHKKAKDKLDDTIRTKYQGYLEEEYDGQMSLFVPEGPHEEPQIEGQLTIKEIMDDWEKTRRAAEAALNAAKAEELRTAKEEALREATDIMNRISDIAPKLEADYKETEELKKENKNLKEQALEEVKSEPEKEEEEELPAEEEVFDDTAKSIMALDESFFEPEAIKEDEPEPEEALAAEPEETTEEEVKEPEPEEAELEEPEEDPVEPVEAEEESALEESAEEEEKIEEPAEEEEEVIEPEEPEEADAAEEAEDSEKPEEPKKLSQETRIFTVPKTDTTGKDIGVGLLIPIINFDEDGNIKEEKEGDSEQPQSNKEIRSGKLTQNTREWKPPRLEEGESMILGQTVAEMFLDEEKKKDTSEEFIPEEEAAPQKTIRELKEESDEEKALKEAEELERIDEELEERTNEGSSKKGDTLKLSDEEKELFIYFLPIEGMEKQITRAATGIGKRLMEKAPASSGNLYIQGGRGSGKSELAKSFVEVLRTEYKAPGDNMGRIYASKLNEKDVKEIYERIRGGCLIIESAGDLLRDTAITLKLLMDTDNSGTLIILEDTRVGIERLKRNENSFIRMFTEKINIPIFSSDELVLFGKKYALDKGCVLDEMASLALYNRIGLIQRLDKPTYLTEVKEIVDKAVENAENAGLGGFFARLAVRKRDENGNLILIEKDFQS